MLKIIVCILMIFEVQAQGYDPWKDAAWTKLRGRLIYEHLQWSLKPCADRGILDSKMFVIDKPLVDSVFQEELDSICKISNARWAIDDHTIDKLPAGILKDKAGRLTHIIIITDCPPTNRGPFFIIYTDQYKKKKKRKGFLRWLFKPR
jgi:hypothetical protein